MKAILIEGTEKELAAFIVALQTPQSSEFVPCHGEMLTCPMDNDVLFVKAEDSA